MLSSRHGTARSCRSAADSGGPEEVAMISRCKRLKLLFICLLCAPLMAQQSLPAPTPASAPNEPRAPEINTVLMESTFRITGPAPKLGEISYGAGFVMVRQVAKDFDQGRYVLVTAKHVFEGIQGEVATVTLRKRNASGDIQSFPFTIRIRDKDTALYTTHPTADVAAIDIDMPKDTILAQLGGNITNVNWLATDDFLTNIAIHPGDELECLGYPLALAAN